MRMFSEEEIASALSYPVLIDALEAAFAAESIIVPVRQHYTFSGPNASSPSTLLLMPAWQHNERVGVKIITVCPENGLRQLPAIQGMYVLMDAHTGIPLAGMEARRLTSIRTAATSALASRILSRPDASTLLVIGTGAVARELIQAHCAVRPIRRILLWGRNVQKARHLAETNAISAAGIEVVEDLRQAVGRADLISCATLSREPLIKGSWLQSGQHLDLVGAYRPDMREADDEAILRARLFADHRANALREGGDLAIPLAGGQITPSAIRGDLFGLCRDPETGRTGPEQITLFKSVGHALEDLVAASLVEQFFQPDNPSK